MVREFYRSRKHETMLEVGRGPPDQADALTPDKVASNGELVRDVRAVVSKAMDTLPEPEAAVLREVMFGKSLQGAADALGIPKSTAHARFAKASIKLGRMLAAHNPKQ